MNDKRTTLDSSMRRFNLKNFTSVKTSHRIFPLNYITVLSFILWWISNWLFFYFSLQKNIFIFSKRRKENKKRSIFITGWHVRIFCALMLQFLWLFFLFFSSFVCLFIFTVLNEKKICNFIFLSFLLLQREFLFWWSENKNRQFFPKCFLLLFSCGCTFVFFL